MTQPKHRPERQSFVVHAGAIAEDSVLPEWWGAIDSDVESRSLRFPREGSTWLDEGEMPESLRAAGCRLCEVVGVGSSPGLTHASLEVGRRVLLQPEPTNPQDHNAIAVWVEDASAQVGYLPGDVAAETMAESMRRRTGYGALVASEVRDKKTHERRALTIFIGPGVIWAEQSA